MRWLRGIPRACVSHLTVSFLVLGLDLCFLSSRQGSLRGSCPQAYVVPLATLGSSFFIFPTRQDAQTSFRVSGGQCA